MKHEIGNSLSALLLDDDKEFLANFSKYLDMFCERNGINIVINAVHEISFEEIVDFMDYDIAFLDIDMPKINGFQVAQELYRLNSNCNIVYVSAKTDLVIESFDYSAVTNFIPKGSSQYVLNKKLEHIFQYRMNTYFSVNYDGVKIDVPIDSIIFLRKEHNDLYIICNEHVFKQRMSLKDAMNKLNLNTVKFVQIHKSIIINVDKILGFYDPYVYLVGDSKIMLSRSFRKQFIKFYQHYTLNNRTL